MGSPRQLHCLHRLSPGLSHSLISIPMLTYCQHTSKASFFMCSSSVVKFKGMNGQNPECEMRNTTESTLMGMLDD
jgi:hypothetical protein